jgi:hypothetical protein
MEVLEAHDLAGCAHSAAQLTGVGAKTVRRYVAARDTGCDAFAPVERESIIDAWRPKIEERVGHSRGKVRGQGARAARRGGL